MPCDNRWAAPRTSQIWAARFREGKDLSHGPHPVPCPCSVSIGSLAQGSIAAGGKKRNQQTQGFKLSHRYGLVFHGNPLYMERNQMMNKDLKRGFVLFFTAGIMTVIIVFVFYMVLNVITQHGKILYFGCWLIHLLNT